MAISSNWVNGLQNKRHISMQLCSDFSPIDADTIACEWDGTPVDYGAIVGHLAITDGLR